MKQIAKNQFYEMAVDPAKNRAYVTIVGDWERASDVSSYLPDWDSAIGEVTRGFTLLSDLTQAKPASPEIKALHEAAQKKLAQAGLGKMADVLPRDAVLKMQVDQVAHKTDMLKMVFASKAEAEAWLDKK
jgi:hypothetical protein